jgi:polyferredoxin
MERVSIYATLALTLLLTALLFISWGAGKQQRELVQWTNSFQSFHGLIVASLLSGAVGVGLYPLRGARVWRRFFCPMAALLGLVRKAGRYRITVKQNMCISCGLCAEVCPCGVWRLENVSRSAPQLVRITGVRPAA